MKPGSEWIWLASHDAGELFGRIDAVTRQFTHRGREQIQSSAPSVDVVDLIKRALVGDPRLRVVIDFPVTSVVIEMLDSRGAWLSLVELTPFSKAPESTLTDT